ncbi:MAG: lytic transglycosylase domain-containing protein [Bacteroidales bacterium]|nr:lytic transglycosylase domain-containing protein [Bacteroidales bacterium]MDD3300242.1 lytic transglycosylase domain-containing protein [Bacteroidales bacterium]MDD4618301.1 lytic transglycosylase domain-containing protein [Bacteroidales bacterium]
MTNNKLARFIFASIPLLTFCSSADSIGPVTRFDGGEGFSQEVRVPPIPEQADFCGEEVPLHYTDVQESFKREITSLSYFHGTMIYTMQLDSRYGATIKRILEEEGVPQDLYYICIAESGIQPVVSPANAAGYWQFLSSTAREYGLVVDSEVDERYNIEKSTRAAAAYFKKAYEEFGSWTMAAASYNTGFSNVRYRMDIQSLDNYYDMQFLEETGRYVFRALAFKTILNNRETYGFYLDREDLYKPLEYKEVEITGAVANWSDFAREHGTNFKVLKIFNQWIRANQLDNKMRRRYIVQVPLKGFREGK